MSFEEIVNERDYRNDGGRRSGECQTSETLDERSYESGRDMTTCIPSR